MQKSATSQLDLSLAREIAQREGIKVIVAGTVAPISGGYAVSARLLNAQTGDDFASAQETVNGAKELIPAIDKISRKLRERIGRVDQRNSGQPAARASDDVVAGCATKIHRG
jgi:hypothetical protein